MTILDREQRASDGWSLDGLISNLNNPLTAIVVTTISEPNTSNYLRYGQHLFIDLNCLKDIALKILWIIVLICYFKENTLEILQI